MPKCKAIKRNGNPCGQTEDLSADGWCKYHNNSKYKQADLKPRLIESLDYLLNEYVGYCEERNISIPKAYEGLETLKNALE